MSKTFRFCIGATILPFILATIQAVNLPTDIINHKRYQGSYSALQEGPSFDYLDGRQGRITALFYGEENVRNLRIRLFDPRYYDYKIAIVFIQDILDIGQSKEWINFSHEVTVITLWKWQEQANYKVQNVTTSIKFLNLEQENYQSVEIQIAMKGQHFQFVARLSYNQQIYSIVTYCLFTSLLAAIQIYSAFMLRRRMELDIAFSFKTSLITLMMLTLNNDLQFCSNLTYFLIGLPIFQIQEKSYLLFLIPTALYLVLIILGASLSNTVFTREYFLLVHEDMWRAVKKLVVSGVQIAILGCLYYFMMKYYSFPGWMVILSNLTLVSQILHNIQFNGRPEVNFYYIFGLAGTPLLLPIYSRLCPDNILRITPNPKIAAILIVIFSLQVLLLFLQKRFGPRLLKRFQPNYYDYNTKVKRDNTNQEQECSICLQNLFQSVSFKSQPVAINASEVLIQQPLLNQAQVMKTPCNHKFHKQCFMELISVRFQCPNCRSNLPPILL